MTKEEYMKIQNLIVQKVIIIPNACAIVKLNDVLETLQSFIVGEGDER